MTAVLNGYKAAENEINSYDDFIEKKQSSCRDAMSFNYRETQEGGNFYKLMQKYEGPPIIVPFAGAAMGFTCWALYKSASNKIYIVKEHAGVINAWCSADSIFQN